jgi:predicted phosphoribosyltransferase
MASIIDIQKYREKIGIFEDRIHAGRLLAEELKYLKEDNAAIVIAIPAGGLPVAYCISQQLKLELEVAIARKLHVPWNPEIGFGAITWNGLVDINRPLVDQLGLTKREISSVIDLEKNIIEDRRKLYKQENFPNLENRIPILVDDGLASGFTMLTTAKAVRKYNPRKIIVAVPTAPLRSIERIIDHVDQIYCLNIRTSSHFAVASAYLSWHDVSNEEAIEYLQAH